MTEARRIEALRAIFAAEGHGQGSPLGPAIAVGIGDDAAVLDPPPGRIVISVDEQVEGTHFRRELLAPEDIGYRATMAAASDLAAMGASPWCAVAALTLPQWVTDEVLEAIARGQRDASRVLGLSIVGGNLARGPVLSIATTVLGVCGTAGPALLRSGAEVGDGVFVTGPLGLASLGLQALLADRDDPALELARAAWRRPLARVADGLRAAKVAHAAIDVSDGLAKDLGALCEASGLAAELDERSLLTFAGACGAEGAARALNADVLEAMVTGGEDYSLLIASAVPLEGFTCIGTFVATPDRHHDRNRVVIVGELGKRRAVTGGYDHFATDSLP